MDPLNKQERTEAFIKMLVLFILAVIIVAIPMFYAFRLPVQEQALNSDERQDLITQMELRNKYDHEFLALADTARSLFLQYSNEKVDVVKGRISNRFAGILNNMEDYVVRVEEDTIRSDLYGHVLDAFNDLFAKMDDITGLKVELKQAASGGGAAPAPELTDDEKLIEVINNALEKYRGNKRDAAKELGMTERRLKKKMRELGM